MVETKKEVLDLVYGTMHFVYFVGLELSQVFCLFSLWIQIVSAFAWLGTETIWHKDQIQML